MVVTGLSGRRCLGFLALAVPACYQSSSRLGGEAWPDVVEPGETIDVDVGHPDVGLDADAGADVPPDLGPDAPPPDVEAPDDAEDEDSGSDTCIPYDPSRRCGPCDCRCTDPPCDASCAYVDGVYHSTMDDCPHRDWLLANELADRRWMRIGPTSDVVDPPGWTYRRDRTELAYWVGFVDFWADVGCADRCGRSGFRLYVIDIASGRVLHIAFGPSLDWCSIREPRVAPGYPFVDYPWLFQDSDPPRPLDTCPERFPGSGSPNCDCGSVWDRIDQWRVPDGCEVWPSPLSSAQCWEIDFPDFDVRYSLVQTCLFPEGYRGLGDGVLYGVVQRNRISTGEWLTPIDLPLPNETWSP